jgi:hypothetical protein
MLLSYFLGYNGISIQRRKGRVQYNLRLLNFKIFFLKMLHFTCRNNYPTEFPLHVVLIINNFSILNAGTKWK